MIIPAGCAKGEKKILEMWWMMPSGEEWDARNGLGQEQKRGQTATKRLQKAIGELPEMMLMGEWC